MSDTKYRYKGPGYLHDVPAKNLTADEFDALPLESQRRARTSGLYAEVKSAPVEKPAEERAENKEAVK